MYVDHWTDEEFQRYIDGDVSPTDSLRIRHLRVCSFRKKTLGQYRLLYRLLKGEPECAIPDAFARTVAARTVRKPFFIPGVWNVSVVTKSFIRFGSELKTLLAPILQMATAQLIHTLPSVLIGAGILALAAAFDRFALEPRLRQADRLGASPKES